VAREKSGREASSTFLNVDAQSVKNTAMHKGHGAGKKVSGIKAPRCGGHAGHAVAV